MPVSRCQQCDNPLTSHEVRSGSCPCCHAKLILTAPPPDEERIFTNYGKPRWSIAQKDMGRWEKVCGGLTWMLIGAIAPLCYTLFVGIVLYRTANPTRLARNDPFDPVVILLIVLFGAIALVGAVVTLIGMTQCTAAPRMDKLSLYGAIFCYALVIVPRCSIVLALPSVVCFTVFLSIIAQRFSNQVQFVSCWLFIVLFIPWGVGIGGVLLWMLMENQTPPRGSEIVFVAVNLFFLLWHLALVWFVRRSIVQAIHQ